MAEKESDLFDTTKEAKRLRATYFEIWMLCVPIIKSPAGDEWGNQIGN